MTAIHVGDKPRLANEAKAGEYYDRCPEDGCVEVDRSHKAGGRDARGDEYLDYSIYSADRRVGGCGAAWARTTEQGAARDHALGREPRWKTQSAAAGRRYFMPGSKAYEDGHEYAFGARVYYASCGHTEVLLHNPDEPIQEFASYIAGERVHSAEVPCPSCAKEVP